MSHEQIALHVDAYRRSGDVGQLLDELKSFASGLSAADAKAAAEPFRDMPEVVIPLYEHVTAVSPNDAQALVVLANSYWLAGRGPDAVSKLAMRAREIDPANRGAWHLWAIAEPPLSRRPTRPRGARRQRHQPRQRRRRSCRAQTGDRHLRRTARRVDTHGAKARVGRDAEGAEDLAPVRGETGRRVRRVDSLMAERRGSCWLSSRLPVQPSSRQADDFLAFSSGESAATASSITLRSNGFRT
jgi:hypothetical protein